MHRVGPAITMPARAEAPPRSGAFAL